MQRIRLRLPLETAHRIAATTCRVRILRRVTHLVPPRVRHQAYHAECKKLEGGITGDCGYDEREPLS